MRSTVPLLYFSRPRRVCPKEGANRGVDRSEVLALPLLRTGRISVGSRRDE